MLFLAGHPFGTCLFLLLIPVVSHMVLAEEDLSLEVTSFNSTAVELACVYKGDEVGILFQLYKDGKACFHSTQNDSDCTYSTHHDCEFHCLYSSYPKGMSFLVNLDGRCNDRMNIRCSVRSQKGLNLDTYYILKAQSDKPEIIINKGQPLEVASTPVSISCSVTKGCNQTELEISGVHVKSVTLAHYKQGDRFNTTANTTGIFNEPGNYTVTCKERGKEGYFAENFTVEVHEKATVEQNEGGPELVNKGNDSIAVTVLAVFVSLFIVICLLLLIILYILRKKNQDLRQKKNQELKSSQDELDLLLDLPNYAGDESGRRDDNNQHDNHQHKRTLPPMLAQNGICGIWINEYNDNHSGTTISEFIDQKNEEGHEEGLQKETKKVKRAQFDDKSIIQEGSSYEGYFALISPGSLVNSNFMVYLTSVLCCSYLDRKFPVVLVLLHKDVLNNSNEKQDKNLMADLEALPTVDASGGLDENCLTKIYAKLQGLPVDTGIGNVGIGLALSYFYGYLAVILPDLPERIKTSEYRKKYGAKMSQQFLIILPEFGRTNDLSEVDSKFSTIKQPLDSGITFHKAWHPHRSYMTYVHKIKMSEEESYYFCGEYGTPISSLVKMLETRKLKKHTEVEMKKQLDQFTDTLTSILQKEDYRDKAVIYRVADVATLADELCERIKNPKRQRPMGTLNQVSRVAQGLAWSYFHHYLAVVGPNMDKRIRESEYYNGEKMPRKVFILLPYSCDSQVLSVKEGNLKEAGTLKRLKNDEPDYEEKYRTIIYEVSADTQSYLACVEYCTRVQVLYEIEQQEPAVLSSMQKAAELRVFYEILYDLLYGSNAPDFCSNFELVYYNDDKNTGKKLSELLVEKIKESLQEEDTILSYNNTSV